MEDNKNEFRRLSPLNLKNKDVKNESSPNKDIKYEPNNSQTLPN